MRIGMLIRDGFEGIIANIWQNICYSIYFVFVVRYYQSNDVGYYVISNMLYATLSALGGLGIGNAYIRSYKMAVNKENELNKFVRMLIASCIFIMILNIAFSFLFYSSPTIHILSGLFSFHILLDSLMYILKYHQFALDKQSIAYRSTIIDASLKCLVGVVCIYYASSSIIQLISIATLLRACLLIALFYIYFPKLKIQDNWKLNNINISLASQDLKKHWRFMLISIAAILNWRISGFVISTYFTAHDITEYEIAFKLFSLAYMIPVVISSSLYPKFISFKEDPSALQRLFNVTSLLFLLYGIMAYTFIYAYSGNIIRILFGLHHADAVTYSRIYFMVLIPYSIIQLQASFLVAAGYEKKDMLGNLLVFTLTFIQSFFVIFLHLSVSHLIYSLLISFIGFELYQIFCLRSMGKTLIVGKWVQYILVLILVILFTIFSTWINPKILFPCIWIVFLPMMILWILKSKSTILTGSYTIK